jgi:FixJ family two-component response regulator
MENPAEQAKRKKVAIVEDDVRDSLGFLPEIAGHVVEAFASAAEFLKAEMDEMACVIADHHRPHMTGLDLLYSKPNANFSESHKRLRTLAFVHADSADCAGRS